MDRSAAFLQQDPSWPWLREQGRQILEEELSRARRGLLKKLDRLSQEQKGEPLRPFSRLRLQTAKTQQSPAHATLNTGGQETQQSPAHATLNTGG